VSSTAESRQDRTQSPVAKRRFAEALGRKFVCEPGHRLVVAHHFRWATSILQRWKTLLRRPTLRSSRSRQVTTEGKHRRHTILNRPSGFPSYDISRPGVQNVSLFKQRRGGDQAGHSSGVLPDAVARSNRRNANTRHFPTCRPESSRSDEATDRVDGSPTRENGFPKPIQREISEAIDFCEFYSAHNADWADSKRDQHLSHATESSAVITAGELPLKCF